MLLHLHAPPKAVTNVTFVRSRHESRLVVELLGTSLTDVDVVALTVSKRLLNAKRCVQLVDEAL